ncbi:hypothetical protein PV416_30075 [Streptomyces ipomoeae]|jgi:ABC-type phosphonate transport system ATPase subunit|uniref:hypothetical protein n=1 Tax=Streptomyces ipomoeae TaxID=103232 RepID=UPI0029B25E59|nr:hypothetical protein [Streptomyces ipomoeae]MDX2825217.1 hypothetical protein [Streptomyces ipomoeae]MDX2877722.1 hypothetical protein [Streptomyces ipomoeae]
MENGFTTVTAQDALHDDRRQLLASNWKVCHQTPQPGIHRIMTPLRLTVVKLREKCPGQG